MDSGDFIIRKVYSSFLVMVNERIVRVEPLDAANRYRKTEVMGESLQTICMTRLALDRPTNSVAYLRQYFAKAGWIIEEAI